MASSSRQPWVFCMCAGERTEMVENPIQMTWHCPHGLVWTEQQIRNAIQTEAAQAPWWAMSLLDARVVVLVRDEVNATIEYDRPSHDWLGA